MTFDEYLGPQCVQCGKEDYTQRYTCSNCDGLVCEQCRMAHYLREQEHYQRLHAVLANQTPGRLTHA